MRSPVISFKNLFFYCKVGLSVFLTSLWIFSEPVLAQKVFSSSGSFASYAIDGSGNLYVWGEDEYLYPVTTTMVAQDLVPVKVNLPNGVSGWTSVAAGHFHSLAMGNTGVMYSWGFNGSGQLGVGTTTDSNTLLKVNLPNGTIATAVACGYDHSMAIGSDGSVYAWGNNSSGQLGNGTTNNSTTLLKVNLPGGFNPVAIFASWNYSFALGADGSLYAWGTNAQGQLGLGNTTNQLLPVNIPLPVGVIKWTAIYGGIYFTVAKGDDGNLYASGYNQYGQLGDGTINNSASFIKVNMPSGVTGWNGIACTGSSVLAIGNNNILYAWGYGGSGEMGNGTGGTESRINTVPVKVTLPNGVSAKSVAASRFGGLIVGSDNYYYAWGQGTEGELGNNSNANSYTPVKVFGLVQTQPEVPILLLPVNGATAQSTNLLLKWSKASEATGYQCQLSLDSTFNSDIIVNDSALADTVKSISGLASSTTYYWRVRSYNNGVLSEFSPVAAFGTLIQPPAITTLISPVNNAINQPSIDTLRCSKALGAKKYNWQVSADSLFSSFIVNDSTSDTTRVVTLMAGNKYYWRVRTINPSGASSFAGPNSFTVMEIPAEIPALILPVNNATNQRADSLTLMWSRVPGAAGYECQLSVDSSFSSLDVEDSTADSTLTVMSLRNLQKYFWRVRAYNAGGLTVFSKVDSFVTIVGVPLRPHIISPFATAGVLSPVTLVWNTSAFATQYYLQISTDNEFLTTIVDTTVVDTSMQLSFPLKASTQYYWRVSASNIAGTSAYSVIGDFTTQAGIDAADNSNGVPSEFSLLQNYPNPFNPTTVIKYEIPKMSKVTIKVYNALGSEIAILIDRNQSAGRYSIQFDGSKFASGVYFFRMVAGTYVKTYKMMLVK